MDRQLLLEARELQEFFLGTYAEEAIESAIKSNNQDLLELAVKEYGNQQELIEEQERLEAMA